MIEVTLVPAVLRVGAPSRVVVMLRNTGPGTCTNINGRLSTWRGLTLVGGSARIVVPRLGPNQSYEHKVDLEALTVGELRMEIVNFSYEDPGGRPRRITGLGWTVEALAAQVKPSPDRHVAVKRPTRQTVFVSYRWSEGEGWSNYVHEKLCQEFGARRVFLDRTWRQPGRDFRLRMDEALRTSVAMAVLVGPDWNAVLDDGLRRLDHEDDYVRHELSYALRVDLGIVPVLFEGATMPNPATLPPDVRQFAYRTHCELHRTRYEDAMQEVVEALRSFLR